MLNWHAFHYIIKWLTGSVHPIVSSAVWFASLAVGGRQKVK